MKGGVCAASINSDRGPVEKALHGYSDDASVFLNGKISSVPKCPELPEDPGFPWHRSTRTRRHLPFD